MRFDHIIGVGVGSAPKGGRVEGGKTKVRPIYTRAAGVYINSANPQPPKGDGERAAARLTKGKGG